jgi:hypothetical protein
MLQAAQQVMETFRPVRPRLIPTPGMEALVLQDPEMPMPMQPAVLLANPMRKPAT